MPIGLDFGESEDVQHNAPELRYVIAPPRLWVTIKIILAPDLWVGESYIAGNWYLAKGDLSEFLAAIQAQARPVFRAYFNFLSSFRGIRHYVSQYILNRYYTRKVRQHYEVDSRIYELFLDEEMIYTCAFFLTGKETLASAQQKKLDLTIERMRLPRENPRVLDIGCGWGGLARALTKNHISANVCGLSISESQIEWARQRDAASLDAQQIARVEYLLEDYVNHRRRDFYDGVSVIGMIEHVGLGGYDEFFAHVHAFLKDGATAVVHTIVSPVPAVPTNAWIDRHIFTGGYAPAVSELTQAAERNSFRIVALHVHAPIHYRTTIECWRANFVSNIPQIVDYLRELEYADSGIDRFLRIWIFYLSGVRNMFDEGSPNSHQVVQLILEKVTKRQNGQAAT